MKFRKLALSVSTLALAAMTLGGLAAAEPVYNPSTAVAVSGVITAIHDVPAGQPLEGVHLTLKNKTGSVEVYVGPRGFLKFLKTSYATGEEIDVTGSRVQSGKGDIILAREVSDGIATITLRNLYGAEAWNNWGVEADPAALR